VPIKHLHEKKREKMRKRLLCRGPSTKKETPQKKEKKKKKKKKKKKNNKKKKKKTEHNQLKDFLHTGKNQLEESTTPFPTLRSLATLFIQASLLSTTRDSYRESLVQKLVRLLVRACFVTPSNSNQPRGAMFFLLTQLGNKKRNRPEETK